MSTGSRQERRAAARAQREAAERAAAEGARRRRRLLQLGGVLLVAAAIVVAVVLIAGGGGGNGPGKQAGESVAGQKAIQAQLGGIPQHDITLGNPKAPVTLVEFGDLQCPVCAAFSNTVLPGVVKKYIRPGKVKLEFRNISFIGPDSQRMARFAAAAGFQDHFFDVAELIYANQGEENSGYATDAFLRKIGNAVPGLNVDRAMAQRTSGRVATQLSDAERLSQIKGVTATPTLFVGKTGASQRKVDPTQLEAELERLTAGTATAASR